MKEIDKMLAELNRGLVATPKTRKELEEFNNSSTDKGSRFLAMQMAIQFGYKLALENLKVEISESVE